MEKLYEVLRGTARVEIVGAQPEKLLTALAFRGVEFWNCTPVDDFTMRLTMYAGNYPQAEGLARHCGCQVLAVTDRGGKRLWRMVKRRRWLAALAAVFAVLIGWSSLYIWDIGVEGNDTVSDGVILRALEENGVGVGTYWPAISNDYLRACVLPELPELSWLSVNVQSSRAVVKVRERVEKPRLWGENIPTNIVAAKTGMITKLSVLQGKPVAGVGSAVVEGEVIVSGAMDSLAGGTRKVHALADAEAHTLYELTAVCPDTAAKKTQAGGKHSRFALIIGENRINFYRSGRNAPSDCDKISKTIPLSIKDVFTLPVALVKETFVHYTSAAGETSDQERLKADLLAELKDRMAPNGQILSRTYAVNRANGLVTVTLRAECLENIAAEVPMTQAEKDAVDFANLNPKEGKNE